MVDSYIALWTLAALAFLIIVIIPVLDSVKKLTAFISLRWTCVALILLIMVGVVLDFSHLSDSTRDIALRGGLIVVGIFLVLRTVEKIISNGWLKGLNIHNTIRKGDFEAETVITQEAATPKKEESVENKQEEKKEENNEA